MLLGDNIHIYLLRERDRGEYESNSPSLCKYDVELSNYSPLYPRSRLETKQTPLSWRVRVHASVNYLVLYPSYDVIG